jgi:hypothetical protein
MKKFLLIFCYLVIQSGYNLIFAQDSLQNKFVIVHPYQLPKLITVGGSAADINGFTSAAIQIAIDALKSRGGGSIKLSAGTFEIMAPVRLADNIELVGCGHETVLHKVDGVKTNFIVDADYGELVLTVADPGGFLTGMGIQIYDKVQMEECWNVTTVVITAISGNLIYIDNFLVRDYHQDAEGVVSNACSVISAVSVDNVRIANLTVEGNRLTNDYVNGCVGGGVYLHKVKNAIVENVRVKDWNGDGISWQITENVTIRNCEVSGCDLGLHPGTGSPLSVIEANNCHDNIHDGLYICWRVQSGFVRDNQFHHNGQYGICTGHKDTDMLFTDNHIYENGSDGVNLREEPDLNAPHRSIFRNNIVENNGTEDGGYGFSFQSKAEGVILENNIIRDTGKGTQKAGVFIDQNALPVILKGNKFSGHPAGDVIDKTKGKQ